MFPLTDDYELVSEQLDKTSTILKGVESQNDIDKMKDSDYQAISGWLEGTQNRKDATSLIGDGVVSCAAMLPGFAYGSANRTPRPVNVPLPLCSPPIMSFQEIRHTRFRKHST